MLFPTLRPSSLPDVVAQPDEKRSGMTDTKHIVQHLVQTKKIRLNNFKEFIESCEQR